jgi:hypothetical protein
VADDLPDKIRKQIARAGLPTGGPHPFVPELVLNLAGEMMIGKRTVAKGPKRGKRGYLDADGRIWVKDRAHGAMPDHWDVQMHDGESYVRIDNSGTEIV